MTLVSARAPSTSGGAHVKPRPPRLTVPFFLIALGCTAWALTLNNGVFIDESVYARAGRAYLAHWLAGDPLPSDIGTGFSGSPVLFPVLAGALDLVGGLAVVRGFSLVCFLTTMLVVRDLTATIFNHRAGFAAAALFGLTGPVLYVAHLGTFDALVILMLALCLWYGVRLESLWSALPMAALLTLAVLTKYTAYVFVPPILVLSMFSPYGLNHSSTFRVWLRDTRPHRRRALRNGIVLGVVGAGVAAVYALASERTRASLEFTTTGRDALSPAPRTHLLSLVPDYAWPILVASVFGVVWLVHARRWSGALFGLGLLATALLLPAGQVQLGEAVSFQKHLAYSSLFLAPLAGWGLARPWRLAIWTPVVVWFLVLTGSWGLFRSHDLVQYPDVRPVVARIELSHGVYLSSSADSLAYYTVEEPGVRWRTTFDLYARGPDAIASAVARQRYDAVIIHAGPTGSTIQDEGQQVLLDALEDSDYQLTKLGEDDEWLIYSRPQ